MNYPILSLSLLRNTWGVKEEDSVDKSEERKVAEMVYGGKPHIVIQESERPDFICKVSDKLEFGIEVTDFYLSESVARLRLISNYANDLLTRNAYRHKDDMQRISVEKVVYRNGTTGEEREIEAIIGEEHTIDIVVSRIKSSIVSKIGKSARYSTDIVDLIIRDVDSIAGFENIEKLIRAVRRTEASEPILDASFREIYLITTQDADWVCVPLRANLFIAEILKFQKLFKEHYGTKIKAITIGEYVVELARHLESTFGHVEYEISKNKQPRLIFGSVAVGYGEKLGLEIFDISIDDTIRREAIDFDGEGDVDLHRFVRAEIDFMFACAPILFPVTKQVPRSKYETT